jgi:hypothetical protein
MMPFLIKTNCKQIVSRQAKEQENNSKLCYVRGICHSHGEFGWQNQNTLENS